MQLKAANAELRGQVETARRLAERDREELATARTEIAAVKAAAAEQLTQARQDAARQVQAAHDHTAAVQHALELALQTKADAVEGPRQGRR